MVPTAVTLPTAATLPATGILTSPATENAILFEESVRLVDSHATDVVARTPPNIGTNINSNNNDNNNNHNNNEDDDDNGGSHSPRTRLLVIDMEYDIAATKPAIAMDKYDVPLPANIEAVRATAAAPTATASGVSCSGGTGEGGETPDFLLKLPRGTETEDGGEGGGDQVQGNEKVPKLGDDGHCEHFYGNDVKEVEGIEDPVKVGKKGQEEEDDEEEEEDVDESLPEHYDPAM